MEQPATDDAFIVNTDVGVVHTKLREIEGLMLYRSGDKYCIEAIRRHGGSYHLKFYDEKICMTVATSMFEAINKISDAERDSVWN